jgi:hypothetical protein
MEGIGPILSFFEVFYYFQYYAVVGVDVVGVYAYSDPF